jgi:hypothetical protein
VFGWLQADTVAAVWIAAAAIHREKNTVEAAVAAGLQPQQAAANKLEYGSPSCFNMSIRAKAVRRSLSLFVLTYEIKKMHASFTRLASHVYYV